jgi:O-antigen/teichoic acid export membrane protein
MGIAMAWIIPAIAAVVAVSLFLAVRGTRSSDRLGSLPSRRELGHAVAGEYVAGIVSTALPLLLPVLVANRLGVEANAYFALPWLVSTSLSMLVWNVSSSLLVEASAAPMRAIELLTRSLRLSMAVAVSGAAVIWVLAPVLLGILGPDYAEHGTWLLRVAVLAVPANALLMTWTTAMRLDGRMPRVIVLQASTGVGILVLAMTLAGPLGVVGIGAGYLVVQVTAAAVIAPSLWRLLHPASTGRHAVENIGRERAGVR